MPYITLYISTLFSFLVIDILMIKNIILPIFERNLGNIMLESPRLLIALLFYLFYVAGILYLSAAPYLKGNTTLNEAVISAFIIGLLAYGTYEFTNYATLRGWTLQMLAVDTLWGGVLTATSLFIGLKITKLISG